jgi:cystathionine beta-lyase/cystathionine gamma-synthase
MKQKGKATRAIHGRRDKSFRSGAYPIYQTTNFAVNKSDDYQSFISDEEEFYIYSRYRNPTVQNVAEKLAKLENGESALVFSSGMAAITSTILGFAKQGDTIAASSQLYGMTYRFLRDTAPKFGIKVMFLDEEGLYNVNSVCPDAKIVYFETPINPTTKCISIKKVIESAVKINAIIMVDNTFASPINQNPIDFGVDIVLHSATKYIGGHSDVMAGAVVSSKKNIQRIHDSLKAFGGCINPIDAYFLDRSLKTLKVRIQNHNENGIQLAKFFQSHSKVKNVLYPGLENSPLYEIGSSQMKGFGGMLCIELENLDAAKTFCDNLKVALNITSLGGIETLVSIPVLTSHIKMDDEELRKSGVTPGMVRISTGLEDIEDLISDFENALSLI